MKQLIRDYVFTKVKWKVTQTLPDTSSTMEVDAMKWSVPTKGKEKGKTFSDSCKGKGKEKGKNFGKDTFRDKSGGKAVEKSSWSQPSSWKGAYNPKSFVPDKGKSKGASAATPTRTSERGVFTGKCHNCGKTGHMMVNCWSPKQVHTIVEDEKRTSTNVVDYLMTMEELNKIAIC